MKCIGIEQWAGLEPNWVSELVRLEHLTTNHGLTGSTPKKTTDPSERFYRLANERFQRPLRFGIGPMKGHWKIGDWTLAEFQPVHFSDVASATEFLVQLRTLYVVDTARGLGEGTAALSRITELAEETGCGVTLFASAFGLSRDGVLPYAVETFEELWRASVEQCWPIVYLPKWDIDSLRHFYTARGFRNMCLYDKRVFERPEELCLPFASQFVYLPDSMDLSCRRSIEHRLNLGMCEFCRS